MTKDILLIGGAGFIGSHLLDELVRNIDNHITVIDDLSTGLLQNIKHNIKKIKFIKKNFLKYKDTKLFDEIYLLAAKVNNRSEDISDYYYNVKIVLNASMLLKNQNNSKFYFMSSGAVYGDGCNLQEHHLTYPSTFYSHSKIVGEALIGDVLKNPFIFRLGNVFGERQRGDCESGIVAIILEALRKKKKIVLYNNGINQRDYIYVKDIVNGICNVTNPDIYNIGSGKTYSTMDLVKASNISYIDGGRKKESHTIQLNIDKIKKINWEPTIDVLDYIKKDVK